MDSTVKVLRFGNGTERIFASWTHAVKTKEYHNLETPAGKLKENAMFVAVDFVSHMTKTDAIVRIGKDEYTTINIKCLDYIKPVRRKEDMAA